MLLIKMNYENGGYDYSGLIQCRLTTLNSGMRDRGETGNALFYETDPDKDWESRARFLDNELLGKCADYPDWGRVRYFRLRGMDLTLSIDNLQLVERPFPDFPTGSYRFSVQVEPDPGALSAIEGPSHFAEPLKINGNGDCERVISEHVRGEVTDEYIRTHNLGRPYREILANEANLSFAVGDDDQHSESEIFGRDHKLAYTLRCSSGLWIAGHFWAIGCHLFAAGNQTDLLADSVDPYTRRSRAVFRWEHLSRACRGYPQWGPARDFRLRGMKISFTESGDFENFLWLNGRDDPAFGRRVKLHVQVTPDPSAESPVAMPITIVDWMLTLPEAYLTDLKNLHRNSDNGCKEVLTR